MDKRDYMALALELAERGRGFTNPNPVVGAVIVKDGRIIGQGYHERCGGLHAERSALANCTEDPKGAEIFVTLEPCCHHGRQPPCTDALIEAGISRVTVGSDDPNPLVAGKGIEILRNAGIEVETGFMKEECDALNPVFFHFIRTGRPYVVMKYAMTLDGKTATHTGASKWISGEMSRRRVHEDRHRYAAIMAGIGTVLTDDPLLTCRIEGRACSNPVRIICDSRLRIPLNSQIVNTAAEVRTIIAASYMSAPEEKKTELEKRGCRVWLLPEKNGHIDLNELMSRLGKEGVDSVLLEGGAALNWSALESGVVNKVQAYIAPKIFGGEGAKTPVMGGGIELPEEAFTLKNTSVTMLGADYLIEGEVEYYVHRDS